MDAPSGFDKINKLHPIATLFLTLALLFTSFVQRSTVNQETVRNNSNQIQQLSKTVDDLRNQLTAQQVIASELKNVKEGQAVMQQSVNRLADELHAWQREERAFHTH
jgi:sensor histidine kinase YesM